MTSPNQRGILEERFLKSNKYFIWVLFEILFELEKYAFLKIAFLGQKNVHFVLNILLRRQFFLAFLDYFIFY